MDVDENEIDLDTLYRHTKRERWGVAVFLWERDEKRAFRFADGEVRVFKKGYYELMVPTVAPGDGSATRLRAEVRAATTKHKEILPTVGHQLLLLLEEYPGGFTGEAWQKKHRGTGRRLKRHRNAAITEARDLLNPDDLAKFNAAGNHQEALDRLIKVLQGTDLVPSAQLNNLKKTRPTQELTTILTSMAKHPHEATIRPFQAALVSSRGPATSWQVVSAPLALLAPKHHMCVRPSVLSTQGKIIRARFNPPKRPDETGYQRYLDVAKAVYAELESLGHSPLDLLDVHDFAWTTLRPAAKAELARIREAEAANAVEASPLPTTTTTTTAAPPPKAP